MIASSLMLLAMTEWDGLQVAGYRLQVVGYEGYVGCR
jgi:hypothetical protein